MAPEPGAPAPVYQGGQGQESPCAGLSRSPSWLASEGFSRHTVTPPGTGSQPTVSSPIPGTKCLGQGQTPSRRQAHELPRESQTPGATMTESRYRGILYAGREQVRGLKCFSRDLGNPESGVTLSESEPQVYSWAPHAGIRSQHHLIN